MPQDTEKLLDRNNLTNDIVDTLLKRFDERMAAREKVEQNQQVTSNQIQYVPSQSPTIEEVKEALKGDWERRTAHYTTKVDELEKRMAVWEISQSTQPASEQDPELSRRNFWSSVSGHPDYKHYLEQDKQEMGKLALRKLPSLLHLQRRETVIGNTELSPLQQPYVMPSVIDRPRGMHQLVSAVNTDTSIDRETYVGTRESYASIGAVYTLLAAAIDGDPTPKSSFTVDNAEGIAAGMWCQILDDAGTWHRTQVVSTSTVTITVTTDSLDFDAAADQPVIFESIGAIAEGGTKPYTFYSVEAISGSLKTIPVLMGITTKGVRLLGQLEQWAGKFLPQKIVESLGWQLLYGDGSSADQLAGFLTATGINTWAWSDGIVGDTMIDALYKGATQIESDGEVSLVLNWSDFVLVALTKNDIGGYVGDGSGVGSVTFSKLGARIAAYPVVIEAALEAGTAAAVDFANASTFYNNVSAAALTYGMINDDFETNTRRLRYEETCENVITRPWSICSIDFDAEPSA